MMMSCRQFNVSLISAHFRPGKVVCQVQTLAFVTSQVGTSHDMQVGKSLDTYVSMEIAPPLQSCSRHGRATGACFLCHHFLKSGDILNPGARRTLGNSENDSTYIIELCCSSS